MKHYFKYFALLAFLFSQKAFSQAHSLDLLKSISSDAEIADIYKANNEQPLLIVNNKVYILVSDCVSEKFAGYSPPTKNNGARSSGGGTAEKAAPARGSGGGVAEVTAPARGSGGGAVEKAAPTAGEKTTQARSSGGGAAEKAAPARGFGGGVVEITPAFTCESDGDKVTLHLRGIGKTDNVRIYYNHSFIASKYFKIKNDD